MTSKRALTRAVQAADLGAIADLLRDLNEAGRKALYAEVGKDLPRSYGMPDEVEAAATLTRLGLATIGEVRRELVWHGGLHHPSLWCDHTADVVSARPPSFRAKLPAALLSHEFGGPWPLIRWLVRAGVCPPVEDEGRWALALASGVRTLYAERHLAYGRLEAVLRDDPELLERDAWLLFRYEEAARTFSTKVGAEPPDANVWSVVLCRLAADGLVDRERLLDEALAGMERDLPPAALGLAHDVHRRVAPTDEELAARHDTHVRLVGNPVPTTQRLAIEACDRLGTAGALDLDRFVEAARVPLQGTQKNVAVAALRLVERHAGDRSAPIIAAAISALEHARDDVQERAVTLIERRAEELDDDDRAALLGAVDVVSPAVRPRLVALCGLDDATPAPPPGPSGLRSAPEGGDVPTREELERRILALPARLRDAADLDVALEALSDGRSAPPARCRDPLALQPVADVQPITEVDELVAIVAGLLEGVGSGVDAERALAWIAAHGAAYGGDGAEVSPLRSRAVAILREGTGAYTIPGNQARADWAQLVTWWLTGTRPPALAHDHEHPPLATPTGLRARLSRRARGRQRPIVGPPVSQLTTIAGQQRTSDWGSGDRAVPAVAGFTGLRVWEVGRAVTAGRSVELLATPTHRTGWIDPVVLIERVGRAGDDVLRFDATQALHRLPPGPQNAWAREARELQGPLGAAVRRRLGLTDEEVPDAGLAAASAPPDLPRLRIVAGTAEMSYSRQVPQVVIEVPEALCAAPAIDDPLRLATYRLARPGYLTDAWWGGIAPLFHGVDELSAGWHTIALPAAPGVAPAVASLAVSALIDLDQPRLHPEPFLVHLLDAGTPLTWEAHQAVAACLLAKAATLRSLAVDVVVAAVEDGRLDPLTLGGAIAGLLAVEVGVLPRVVDPLRDAASVSPFHAGAVVAVLAAALADLEGTPRGLDGPVGLLRDLTVEHACRLDHPGLRERLEAWSSGSSKRAKAARAALAAEGEIPLVASAQRALVAARHARAALRA